MLQEFVTRRHIRLRLDKRPAHQTKQTVIGWQVDS